MTNAEFQILYRSLFLTQEEVAQIGGYKTTRQVRRFINGEAEPHDDLVETLLDIDESMDETVDRVVEMLVERELPEIVLLAYRDQAQFDIWSDDDGMDLVNLHRAMLHRIVKAVAAENIAIHIVEFDEDAFCEFCDEHGIDPDEAGQEHKATWATLAWKSYKDRQQGQHAQQPQDEFLDLEFFHAMAEALNEQHESEIARVITEPFDLFLARHRPQEYPELEKFPMPNCELSLDWDGVPAQVSAFGNAECTLLIDAPLIPAARMLQNEIKSAMQTVFGDLSAFRQLFGFDAESGASGDVPQPTSAEEAMRAMEFAREVARGVDHAAGVHPLCSLSMDSFHDFIESAPDDATTITDFDYPNIGSKSDGEPLTVIDLGVARLILPLPNRMAVDVVTKVMQDIAASKSA